MGAKQSKRSVDISGKEAEGAGEVAAAGAGGEGRLEQLADADLKPQLNGAAHIQPIDEQTDKEKQVDSGTPENEKDATTEKEELQKDIDAEKENVPETPVTNGETELKTENGESTPAPEEGKKPKKEKVKKKWSLRSISFSRKDKPKQEKKSKEKEEEPKTNGEPEKVPEEAAEVASETVEQKSSEEAKVDTESKDGKSPETPVTEPMTNGSSTPETPKLDSPVIEAEPASEAIVPVANVTEPVATITVPVAVVTAPIAVDAVPVADVATPVATETNSENDRPEPETACELEQLPMNGLSLGEHKEESSQVVEKEESKTEEPINVTTDTAPATEILDKTEVCVKQAMHIESLPPPLPVNPPPSSVASFAATTMAPELTDASLANNTETAISAPPSIPNDNAINDIPAEIQLNLSNTNNETVTNDVFVTLKEDAEATIDKRQADVEKADHPDKPTEVEKVDLDISNTKCKDDGDASKVENHPSKNDVPDPKEICCVVENPIPITFEIIPTSEPVAELPLLPPLPEDNMICQNDKINEMGDTTKLDTKEIINGMVENVRTESDSNSTEINRNEKIGLDGNENETEQENFKNKTKLPVYNILQNGECNGNVEEKNATLMETVKSEMSIPEPVESLVGNVVSTSEVCTPESVSDPTEAAGGVSVDESSMSESFPPPPAELCAPEPLEPELAPSPQDALPISDKLADLIPEVPVVPELKTETLLETTSDVAVAN